MSRLEPPCGVCLDQEQCLYLLQSGISHKGREIGQTCSAVSLYQEIRERWAKSQRQLMRQIETPPIKKKSKEVFLRYFLALSYH